MTITKHPLYIKRNGMISRCYNEKQPNYRFYGAKGVRVCDEWRASPQSFIDWGIANGWQEGLEIDRINPKGHYEPGNVRFVSKQENLRHRDWCRFRKQNLLSMILVCILLEELGVFDRRRK